MNLKDILNRLDSSPLLGVRKPDIWGDYSYNLIGTEYFIKVASFYSMYRLYWCVEEEMKNGEVIVFQKSLTEMLDDPNIPTELLFRLDEISDLSDLTQN